MIESLVIKNPKRQASYAGHDGWYPYYAGYSSDFVNSIIESSNMRPDSCVLDPWNGSGTTTTNANKAGFRTIGYDLNPVMVIAAKACLVNRLDFSSLAPISKQIINCVEKDNSKLLPNDPLCAWLKPSSAIYFRKIERAIQKVLVNSDSYCCLADSDHVNSISSIASFFYVALFRVLNQVLANFRPTNPTWIKLPKSQHSRVVPKIETIKSAFYEQINLMLSSVSVENIAVASNPFSNVLLASSCAMPALNESVDLIISSPPYCTRIDYAVATMPELTLLGYQIKSSLDALRRSLIGTSTVSKDQPEINANWGTTCLNFINSVRNHESKASRGYYYKSHVQYFDSIFRSISEIERVMRPSGVCVLVVQDSHYKEVFNNLPLIFSEMAQQVGLTLVKSEVYSSVRNMAKLNPEVKKYRTHATAAESVLCFTK